MGLNSERVIPKLARVPNPAKKSTKLGAGGFIRSFEQLEDGLSKGDFGRLEIVTVPELNREISKIQLTYLAQLFEARLQDSDFGPSKGQPPQ